MHVWFNWQHLELNLSGINLETGNERHAHDSFNTLDTFMLGGVIFF